MAERSDDPAPAAGNDVQETVIARVMTSTSMDKHPTAFYTTGLPVLQVALNVDAMTRHLAPWLASLVPPGHTPVVGYAKLIAYKQGNRGLIHYEVTSREGGPRRLVFGKLYPAANQAERVEATMRPLWAGVIGGRTDVGIPQPLGVIPDLSMLVYLPAEGRFLDEVILEDEAVRYMDLAGTWLGLLHQSRLPLERRFQPATEIANLHAWAALIGHKYPDQTEDALRISQLPQDALPNLGFAAEAPIHKDFHYGHIVVGDGLKIIDFDEMRLGDPNFDLAHFCANLYLLAQRKNMPPRRCAELQSVFVRAYARQTGWTANPRFVYFYGYTCLKIAKQLCTRRGLRPRPEGEEQYRQLRLMVAHGLAALGYDVGRQMSGTFATLIMSAPGALRPDGAAEK
jgi:hypothetical protein